MVVFRQQCLSPQTGICVVKRHCIQPALRTVLSGCDVSCMKLMWCETHAMPLLVSAVTQCGCANKIKVSDLLCHTRESVKKKNIRKNLFRCYHDIIITPQ